MMLLEALAFAGGLVATAVVGIPIARAASARRIWGAVAPRDPTSRRTRVDVVRAFAPLDLGEDPVKWPSERQWDLKSTLQRADWPSKTWGDAHFGRGTAADADVEDRGFHAMAARHAEVGPDGAPAPKIRPPKPSKSAGRESFKATPA
ncbi:MAG: hypothetical protein ABMB14_35195, partial [Myxococcota bacterium]